MAAPYLMQLTWKLASPLMTPFPAGSRTPEFDLLVVDFGLAKSYTPVHPFLAKNTFQGPADARQTGANRKLRLSRRFYFLKRQPADRHY